MKAWAKGDRVVQPNYGPGTLVEVNEHHTVIDFDDGAVRRFVSRLVTLRNPFRSVRDSSGAGRRGMEFMHDVRDWLGGFPYEFATPGAVLGHLRAHHGAVLERLVTHDGNACNEFVFRRV